METGSLADWVSGIATTLATVVALGSYFWMDRHRGREAREFRQGCAYQIGYKLMTLMSEATYTHSRLFPEGSSAQDWQGIIDPFEIVGAQQPPIGSNITMARDLSNAEQNLLMSLKEEEFLMSMSEAFARHETVRDGIAEYKMRHAAITERAPAPEATNGEVATFMLTNQQKNELWPYVMPAASLLTSLRDLSAINLKELQLMGVAFHPMMRRHYPGLHIHKIETIEAD